MCIPNIPFQRYYLNIDIELPKTVKVGTLTNNGSAQKDMQT